MIKCRNTHNAYWVTKMSKIQRIIFLLCTWVALAGNAVAVGPENGWWWNPSESGSGYAIERQGNSIFMAAFLYESSGEATWYATLLALQPDGTYKGDMTRYAGGKSLLGTYKAPTSTSVVASATATFLKPDNGTMTISFPDGAPNRTIPISRFGFASPSFEPSQGSFQNGWWWNDQESGTGYFVEVQGNQAFIASFMYDTTGQPTWYASVANLSGTNTLAGPVDMFANGQSIGGAYKAPTVNSGAAGTMSFGLTSDSIGSMTLPNNGRVAIKRFVFDAKVVGNHAPVPNAGTAQTVQVGDTVYLNGSGTDSDNDPITYSWNFLNAPTGSTTPLYGWQTSRPNFVADLPGTYRFGLLVDDGKVSSPGSVVTVTAISKAAPTNTAPVANAGANQGVRSGARVTLNGSTSSDANGDVLTYAWFFVTKPAGSSTVLTGASTVTPSFTADVAGSYVIGLTVNDGKVSSSQSSVTVSATGYSANVLCDKEDFSLYISGKNECLVMRKFGSDKPKVMLIWLHGDISSGGPANYHFRDAETATSKLKDFSPLSVALVRPGYDDGSGRTSTVAEGHGARQDHYTNVNITEVASAIDNLKSYYKPEKTILIGHSGGAAYAANIIGMFPDTAQGAVIVSCPCDLQAWRSGRQPWTASEDPKKWISFIKSTTQVAALTGDGDTNTLPILAENYVAQLVQRGIQAEFTLLANTPHNGALASNGVITTLNKMIGQMQK
jgi:hypothetical protein